MESDCQAIKNQFANAANSLSQFFTGSINLQKKAYLQGKMDAFREVIEYCHALENEESKLDPAQLKSFIEQKIKEAEEAEDFTECG